jgi:hypothetical protein
MRCPHCTAQNPPEAATCSECGENFKKLTASAPPLAPTVETKQGELAEALEVEIPLVVYPVASVVALTDAELERASLDEENGEQASYIPYENPKALAAYYLGIFAMVPILGLLLAPCAIVLGILGLRKARTNPQIKGGVHAAIGVTLGVLSLIYNPLLMAILLRLDAQGL